MSETADIIDIQARDDGWLVASDGRPIGYVTQTGQIMTPAGAAYVVREDDGDVDLVGPDGVPVAEYCGGPKPTITQSSNDVTWKLVPDWQSAVRGDETHATLSLPDAFSEAYTLEDAQGTVPARVKLLLAYLVVKGYTSTD